MRIFPALILGCAVPLLAQQADPKEGTTLSLPIIPTMPASKVVDPDKVLLEIGDIKITARQLDALVDVYPENTQVFARGPGREQFADTIVRMVVLAQEAQKRKLDQTEKFKEQLRFSQYNLLASTLSSSLPSQVNADDLVLRKYFEDHRCEFQNWKARHVVVRSKGSQLPVRAGQGDLTEEEALARAQDLRKRLAAGADFSELARQESDDPSSGTNGGDMGQIRHGQIIPSLEEALCSMNAGEISQPIKTTFGYHVIRLDSKEAKTFEELKPMLEQKYRADAAKKYIDDLIAKTKVVKNPEYYAPPDLKPVDPAKQ